MSGAPNRISRTKRRGTARRRVSVRERREGFSGNQQISGNTLGKGGRANNEV